MSLERFSAGLSPGESRHLEASHHDMASPCAGDSNLTNAAQVIFF